MKKLLCFLMVAVVLLSGCATKRLDTKNETPLEFTVVDREQIPEELLAIIGERKAAEFSMTYSLDGYLYIAVGYGTRDTGGYSISVDKLCETDTSIVIDTTLIGPKSGEPVNKMATYPFVVVKLEFRDKNVIFE